MLEDHQLLVLSQHSVEDGRIYRHLSYVKDKFEEVFYLRFEWKKKIINDDKDQIHVDGIKYKSLDCYGEGNSIKKRILFLQYMKNIRKIIFDLGIDPQKDIIIHVHDPMLIIIGSKLKKILKNSYLVYDRHEKFEQFPRHFFIKESFFYERLFFKYVDGAITVTEDMSSIVHALSKKNIPTVVIPNYPSSKLFDNNLIEDKILNFNSKNILSGIYIGSLNSKLDRDLSLMVRVMEGIILSGISIKFIIGGSNELPDEIKYLTNKYPHQVLFIGRVPYDRVMKETMRSNIGLLFLKSSVNHIWGDTSANKLYEYLYCGVIPIVKMGLSNEDKKIIKDCGLVFERNTQDEEIVKRVIKFLKTQDIKKHMLKCRNYGKKKIFENVQDRYFVLYEKIITS